MLNDRRKCSLTEVKKQVAKQCNTNLFFNLNANIQTTRSKKLEKKYLKMLTVANSDGRLVDEFYFLYQISNNEHISP